jgi:hypothetical protein
MIGDIAFVFLEVLLVTMILHRLLVYREKKALFKKLNMVIGTFFIEVGTDLLKKCSDFDKSVSKITGHLVVKSNWTIKEFAAVIKALEGYMGNIDISKSNLKPLKDFLLTKRPFLLDLLRNPNLLEHESFTDLLWAVFHLTDELAHRDDLDTLPKSDLEHLTGDLTRAYSQLTSEWMSYMKYLKDDYPYLFSLALRTNPFDTDASVEVT